MIFECATLINMKRNIFVMGASGSGTSTLGQRLSEELSLRWIDLDDIFWLPTTPAYTARREKSEMQRILREKTLDPGWVLSGSMLSWGEFLAPEIHATIFLYVPTDVRLKRILAREHVRRGTEEWERDKQWNDFYDWARGYDTGALGGRSLPLHEEWLKAHARKLLRLEGDSSVEENLNGVRAFLAE